MQTWTNRIIVFCFLFPLLAYNPFAAADENEPVSIKANIVKIENDESRFRIVVQLEIEDGWHTYDQVPEGNPAPITEAKLELPDGVRAVGDWERPIGIPYSEDPTAMIFEGKVKFACEIEADPGATRREIGIEVDYQVCDDQKCLPPETFQTKLIVPATKKPAEKMVVKNEATEVFKFTNKYFQAPVRLMVGDDPLNTKAKQMYPSPAMFDVDDDGQVELIVGDIFGTLNVYENENDSRDGDPVWSDHSPLKTADGKKIKVSNW